MIWTRLSALIVKELLAAFRDPRARMALVVPPLIQLFLFAYAATLEVSNVPIGVLNQDWGLASEQLISRFERASRLLRDPPLCEPRRGQGRHRPAGGDDRRPHRAGLLAQARRRRAGHGAAAARRPQVQQRPDRQRLRRHHRAPVQRGLPRGQGGGRARSSTAPGTTPTASTAPPWCRR